MWYLLKRGLQMLVILAILSAALFGLLSSMPGNPIDLLITSNPNVKPEDVIRLKRLRGLDQPWYIQYVRWLFGYPEPARPPMVLAMTSPEVTNEQSSITFNVADFLADPNFVPDMKVVEQWLTEVWPQWQSSKVNEEITTALNEHHLGDLLMAIARVDNETQNRLVRRIERESVKGLTVTGLFGATANGFNLTKPLTKEDTSLWFLVKNSYGQERVGRVMLRRASGEHKDLVTPIGSQIVEDERKPFTVDLSKFLVDNSVKTTFSIVDSSIGTVNEAGVFTHTFTGDGQSAVLLEAKTDTGLRQQFAFDVEHGVVGHHDKYNKGFLHFFTGDRNALGFSQTYKRPVYDLLFGTPPICGDGRIDSGETCDDGNKKPNDGCSADCFNETDTISAKADALVSGYIVRSGRIGNTIQLMLPALLLSLIVAIPLGVFSAYRQYSVLDYIINFLAFIGISLPVFWFGIMMIFVFAEGFQLFPAGGVQTPGIYGEGTWPILLDRMKHAILPTIVLSIFYVGRWLRYMRASMLEVLPKDYIRTARAKGLSERAVILKHAFRNALIPVVTVLALSIPSLFGGAVLTETVFSWPGVGRLQYEAVMNSDYYVAIIVFLVSAVLVMVGNLLADAVYVLVDPRIRKQ